VSVTSKVYLRCPFELNQGSGGINMPSLLPIFGRTQLEVLSVVGSVILIGSHVTTLTTVKERILLSSGYAQALSFSFWESDSAFFSKSKKSFLQELNDLWVNARNLPPIIRQIVRHVFLCKRAAH
jgi:solute carrier family 45, member 1/2/4